MARCVGTTTNQFNLDGKKINKRYTILGDS